MRLMNRQAPVDVADYILQFHKGNARAAIEAMQEEIEHFKQQLNIAATAMGRGYTRGWVPIEERNEG